MAKCKAITNFGIKCPHEAVVDGFCMMHFQHDRGLMRTKKDEQDNTTGR